MARELPPNKWLVRMLFHDPTPTGQINARIFQHLLTHVEPATTLRDEEKDRFFRTLLMIANKMASVWYHLSRYRDAEAVAVDKAMHDPIVEGQDNPHIDLAMELFYEFDSFLVQVKSTLDHLVKMPQVFIGRSWSLTTFGARGQDVQNAARNVHKDFKARATGFIMLVQKHALWLEALIAARDRANHFQEGGLDAQYFAVFAQKARDGATKVTVPMWSPEESVNAFITQVWPNFFAFCEDFVATAMVMRIREDLSLVRLPGKHPEGDETVSPWRVIPVEETKVWLKDPRFKAYEAPPPASRLPGRKDPCHCGSGERYKNCCLGKDQEAARAKRQ